MTEFWKNNVNREEALLKLHQHIQTITQKEKFNPHEETVEIRGHTIIIEKVPFTNYGPYVKEKQDKRQHILLELEPQQIKIFNPNNQSKGIKIKQPFQVYSTQKSVIRNIDSLIKQNEQSNAQNKDLVIKQLNFLDSLQ
ncbi:Hypothetical_protein [Hexamita inflata]|uniref:Hypothetical_protein n=1 Tax=Hexamita inflata TaxID=28002 RepID=A0AA86PC28_9EUKA|nr:Hypothetical protein HINF_LOCUS23517 [Hexamita inflata]